MESFLAACIFEEKTISRLDIRHLGNKNFNLNVVIQFQNYLERGIAVFSLHSQSERRCRHVLGLQELVDPLDGDHQAEELGDGERK